MRNIICAGLLFAFVIAVLPFAHAMTKGLSNPKGESAQLEASKPAQQVVNNP
jgi:hypothetical protein